MPDGTHRACATASEQEQMHAFYREGGASTAGLAPAPGFEAFPSSTSSVNTRAGSSCSSTGVARKGKRPTSGFSTDCKRAQGRDRSRLRRCVVVAAPGGQASVPHRLHDSVRGLQERRTEMACDPGSHDRRDGASGKSPYPSPGEAENGIKGVDQDSVQELALFASCDRGALSSSARAAGGPAVQRERSRGRLALLDSSRLFEVDPGCRPGIPGDRVRVAGGCSRQWWEKCPSTGAFEARPLVADTITSLFPHSLGFRDGNTSVHTSRRL